MYSFTNFELVCCFMAVSNCCCLTWKKVSQEPGKVAWYSHLLKNFSQFVVIHTVKDFSVVNEAEVDVFLEFLCFFYDPTDVHNLISVSFAFSKSSLYIWKYSWSLAWRILSIALLACEMSVIMYQFEYFLKLLFFWITMKTDLFQSCDHCYSLWSNPDLKEWAFHVPVFRTPWAWTAKRPLTSSIGKWASFFKKVES